MEDAPNGANGKVSKKGKDKATCDDEEDSEEDSDDDSEDIEVEEFVLCTLDTTKNFQQPLDITIGEHERVFFKVSGTHTIYLTGNYVIPQEDGHNHHHEVYDSDDDESDDLDTLENPRVTEVDSDDEEAPKLVSAEKKGKNKRSADEIEEGASLDDIMAKSLKPDSADEQKLSKKQLKKLKKNNGEAAAVKAEESKKADAKESPAAKSDKSDKKVQFAKNLEQGPTGSAEKAKAAAPDAKGKATLGVKMVQGVKCDDKKLGTGPACKKGNRVGMRYIGKFEDGKVFDSNKKASLSHSSSELAKLSRDGTLVSLVCRSVASADSPFPQTSPTAAKVFLVSPETPPSPSTSSCWESSKLVTDISFLVRMFSVDLFANVGAEALLIDPSPLYNSDTPLMQRLGCLIFLHCVAPYRSFA